MGQAADVLGISFRALRYKMKKLGISPQPYLPEP
jgi:DNA-binding NtrC family response regulator